MKSAPRVWIFRAGRHGADEELALSTGRAIIGWREHGDAANLKTYEAVEAEMASKDETGSKPRIANFARQFWAFIHEAQVGDTVALPLKTSGQIALGTIEGPYEYVEVGGELRHTRRVKWIRPDVPRSSFKQDLLFSLGAAMTVCRVKRNNAEERIAAVLAGSPDPGPKGGSALVPLVTPDEGDDEVVHPTDIAQAAQDEVISYIRSHFPSHDLARLIGAVLAAEGFVTKVSPPGPDGGADILAGSGPLGLDSPSLCVQVKATEAPADVKIFRELVGTMNAVKADQGLLVCWGGFTQSLKLESRQQAFKVRLWDQSDIVNAVYRAYERLDADMQAELPLKRVWMLVREDVEE